MSHAPHPHRHLPAGVLAGCLLAWLALLGSLGWPGEWSINRASLFVAASLATTAGSVWLYRLDILNTRQVLVVAILLRVLVLPMPHHLTDDSHRYLWDGLIQQQGLNPYHDLPGDPVPEFEALRQHPAYEKMNSARFHSVYPPLSQVIFFVGSQFERLQPGGGYLGIKLILAALELAGLLALAKMAAARHLILYALSPLVVIELVGQMHTEAAMVGLLLVGVRLVRLHRPRSAALAIAAAGMVKLYPLVLLPLLLKRFGWRPLWPGVLLAGLATLPYASADAARNYLGSLQLYVGHFEFYALPYYLLRGVGWGLQEWTALPDPRPLAGALLAIVFVLVWAVALALHRAGRLGFEAAAFLILTAYPVCSTTVHPWYFAGMLAMLPLIGQRWRLPWVWLAAWSAGTYLRYLDGPYWPFVWIGWGGWLIGMLLVIRRPVLHALLQMRARTKAEWFASGVSHGTRKAGQEPACLLDIGAGEGLLGLQLQHNHGLMVELAEVRDPGQVALPLTLFDGRILPFPDRSFDLVTLSFVLHHARDPDVLLREAARVCRRRVLILESWSPGPWRRRLLAWVDRLVNSLRGCPWNDPIHYRSPEAWIAACQKAGLDLCASRTSLAIFHHWVHLELAPHAASAPVVAPGEHCGIHSL